ncbi:WhiB family transcriptional regulator [Aeromicrobium sp. CTD01-1L150]|uniref:WhiB family transcriptional regulator n=1 Tax=Aeromicrobium sp. CTD01-1L150 TaxID=3341830 RepID=UPI0035C14C21
MANLAHLPMPLQEVYEWQYESACQGLESARFFSPDAERGARRREREEQAKKICGTCPVLRQCREHALSAREPYGVWGGLTEHERADIIAARDTPMAS